MSFQVLEYVALKYTNLYTLTTRFRDAMFNTTISWQMVDSAASRVALLKYVTVYFLSLVFYILLVHYLLTVFSLSITLIFARTDFIALYFFPGVHFEHIQLKNPLED